MPVFCYYKSSVLGFEPFYRSSIGWWTTAPGQHSTLIRHPHLSSPLPPCPRSHLPVPQRPINRPNSHHHAMPIHPAAYPRRHAHPHFVPSPIGRPSHRLTVPTRPACLHVRPPARRLWHAAGCTQRWDAKVVRKRRRKKQKLGRSHRAVRARLTPRHGGAASVAVSGHLSVRPFRVSQGAGAWAARVGRWVWKACGHGFHRSGLAVRCCGLLLAPCFACDVGLCL
jgi:hypothetical protein